jgi:hypothetical protein
MFLCTLVAEKQILPLRHAERKDDSSKKRMDAVEAEA